MQKQEEISEVLSVRKRECKIITVVLQGTFVVSCSLMRVFAGWAQSPEGCLFDPGRHPGFQLQGAASPATSAPLQRSTLGAGPGSAPIPLHVAPTRSHFSVPCPSAPSPLPMAPVLYVGSCHGPAAVAPLPVPMRERFDSGYCTRICPSDTFPVFQGLTCFVSITVFKEFSLQLRCISVEFSQPYWACNAPHSHPPTPFLAALNYRGRTQF